MSIQSLQTVSLRFQATPGSARVGIEGARPARKTGLRINPVKIRT